MYPGRNQKGVTLLELLIAIVVIAILVTWAVPNFQETIRSNQVAAQNNELIGLIHLARNEAIRRNPQGATPNERTVRVQLTAGAESWRGVVRPPSAIDPPPPGCPVGTIRCSENQRVVLSFPSGASDVRFDNRGYSVNNDGDITAVNLQLVHANANSPRHRRCVRVFPGGQVVSEEGTCS